MSGPLPLDTRPSRVITDLDPERIDKDDPAGAGQELKSISEVAPRDTCESVSGGGRGSYAGLTGQ